MSGVKVDTTISRVTVEAAGPAPAVSAAPQVIRISSDNPNVEISTSEIRVGASAVVQVPQVSAAEIRVIQVGQQGPIGPAGGGAPKFEAVSKETGMMPAGAAVALHATGVGIVLANAETSAKLCVGLLVGATDPDLVGVVQTAGPMTLDDWSEITGTVTLAARGIYFLDVISGKLSTTAQTTHPAIVQQVGVAVSPDTLLIEDSGYVQL